MTSDYEHCVYYISFRVSVLYFEAINVLCLLVHVSLHFSLNINVPCASHDITVDASKLGLFYICSLC